MKLKEGTLDHFFSPHSCSPSCHYSCEQAAFGTSPLFSLTFHFTSFVSSPQLNEKCLPSITHTVTDQLTSLLFF